MRLLQPETGVVVERLRAERSIKSQELLAEAAKVSRKTVERVENGERFRVSSLTKIAAALGTTVDEIEQRSQRLRDGQAHDGGSTLKPPRLKFESDAMRVFFDGVDGRVLEALGHLDLHSPTRSSAGGIVTFQSRRLFSSLSAIDIPPDIIFHILADLPAELSKIAGTAERFSTPHIRRAIAQLISAMPDEAVISAAMVLDDPAITPPSPQSRKFDWASRYSRRYGDPNQAITIIHEDGNETPLDFAFLKSRLVPETLGALLGANEEARRGLITGAMVERMAEYFLREFRRLGLYQIRYKTARRLAEELLIQPPHPWLVTAESRDGVVDYDRRRALAHLEALKSIEVMADADKWHQYSELAHHCCALILGAYGSFIGKETLTPLSVLKSWLAIGGRNIALWEFCELRFMTTDLQAINVSQQELTNMLEKVGTELNSKRGDNIERIPDRASQLFDIATRLVERREMMRAADRAFTDSAAGTGTIDRNRLVLLWTQAFSAIFPSAKPPVPLTVHGRQSQVTFRYNHDFSGTALERNSKLCILHVFDDDEVDFASALQETSETLYAHHMADVAFILCRRELSTSQKALLRKLPQEPGRPRYVICAPFPAARVALASRTPRDAFLEQVEATIGRA